MTRKSARWSIRWVLTVWLASLLAACASGTVPTVTSRTPSAFPHSTPTALPSGTILYQADWVQRLNDWQPSVGWSVVNGVLQSPTQGTVSLTVPYHLAVTDYALQFRLRVFKLTQIFGSYLLQVAPQSGQDGYQAEVIGFPRPDKETNSIHPQVEVHAEPFDEANPGTAHDQQFGFVWHMYRLEVHGARVEFFIDGQLSGRALGQTRTLASSPIRLEVTDIGLQISQFQVVIP